MSVEELIQQQRRLRKEYKVTATGLKKETETLSDKITKHATVEKGLRSRSAQQKQHIQQAEDAIVSIGRDLEVQAEIPADELQAWQEQKSHCDGARIENAQAQEDLQRTKESNSSQHHSLNADEVKVKQYNERLQQRILKQKNQYQRLTSSTENAGAQRKWSDATDRARERLDLENHYQSTVDEVRQKITNTSANILSLRAQYEVLSTALGQAQNHNQAYARAEAEAQARSFAHARHHREDSLRGFSRSVTPEGDLPGTVPLPPPSTRPLTFGLGAFKAPEHRHGQLAGILDTTGNSAIKGHPSRARSSTVQSGNTIWQDCDGGESPPPPYASIRRNASRSIAREASENSSGNASPKVLSEIKEHPTVND